MEGKRGRGRLRQKLMDWMMKEGYGKLKGKAQHREEWSCWTFGPAEREADYLKKKKKSGYWMNFDMIQTMSNRAEVMQM